MKEERRRSKWLSIMMAIAMALSILTGQGAVIGGSAKKVEAAAPAGTVGHSIGQGDVLRDLDGEEVDEDEEIVKAEEGYDDTTICPYTPMVYSFIYNDNMFMKDANHEYTDMTKIGINLSEAAYNEEDLESIYSHMGFSFKSFYYDRDATYDDNDFVAFSFGHKEVNGYQLFLLTIRGTYENEEWFSNFNVGNNDDHEGFSIAAAQVMEKLDVLIPFYAKSKFNKILVTGHSRGAAVANIVAASISNEYSQFFSTSDVFGYTYACPGVSTNADKTLNNIHNYNIPGDVVPTMPLDKWGFGRNGKDHKLIAEGDIYNNFLFQFERSKDRSYTGLESTQSFVQMIEQIAPTLSDYQNKQFIFKSIAAFLASNGINVQFLEYEARIIAEVDVLKSICETSQNRFLNALSGGVFGEITKMNDIAGFISSYREEYDRIEEIYKKTDTAMQEYYEAKAEYEEDNDDTLTFDEWAECEPAILDSIEDEAEITIHTLVEFNQAKSIILTSLDAIENMQDSVVDLGNLLFLFKGDIGSVVENVSSLVEFFVTGIGDAHEPKTYRLWIESQYYGDYGWYENNNEIDELVIPDTITRIGNHCFNDCKKIRKVVIPDSVLTIGWNAFSGCTGIEYVTIPVDRASEGNFSTNDLISIHFTYGHTGRMKNNHGQNDTLKEFDYGSSLASDSTSLAEISFDDSITYIGDLNFNDCIALVDVTLPNSLKGIGEYAFAYCSALEEISLPDNVEIIEEGCFENCSNMTRINLPNSLKELGARCFYDCSKLTIDSVLPKNLRSIGNDCFYNIKVSDQKLILPDSLELMGYDVFKNVIVKEQSIPCNIYSAYVWSNSFDDSLEKLIFTKGTNGILSSGSDYDDFDSYNNLKSITFSEGITEMGEYFFSETDLSRFTVTYPSTLKKIGDYAFYKCKGLEEFTVPESVTTLGESVFKEATIKRIVLPENMQSIGEACFKETSIESIVMPKTLNSLGKNAFGGCDSLTSISIPTGITSIDEGTFSGCSGLKTLVIPEGVTSIGDHAFSGCSGLKTLVIPEGVTSIGDYAFSGCVNLTSLQLPKGVKSLGECVFYGCEELKTVELPESLTTLVTYSFDGVNFDELVIPGGVTTLCEDCFGDGNIAKIEIPATVTTIEDLPYIHGCTVYCYTNSAAHIYAQENDYDFVLLDAPPHEHSYVGSITEEASCTEDGVKTFTCSCGDSYTEPIPATGHSYNKPTWNWTGTSSAVATFECTNGCGHEETANASITSTVTKEASCEEKGTKKFTANVVFNNKTYTANKSKTIAAKGHSYGEPKWTWTGTTAAVAKFTCSECGHVENVDASITNTTTKAATCEGTGIKTYTATVLINGKTYTSNKNKTIAAKGHSYGTPTWTWNGTSKATALFTCSRNSSHTRKRAATITNKITTKATLTKAGVRTYTATATLDDKTYTTNKQVAYYLFDKSKTGLQNYEGVLYYARNGVRDTSIITFAKYGNYWYYVYHGKVDSTRKGIFKGKVDGVSASWYVKNGRVQLTYSGTVKFDGKSYKIQNGKVVK